MRTAPARPRPSSGRRARGATRRATTTGCGRCGSARTATCRASGPTCLPSWSCPPSSRRAVTGCSSRPRPTAPASAVGCGVRTWCSSTPTRSRRRRWYSCSTASRSWDVTSRSSWGQASPACCTTSSAALVPDRRPVAGCWSARTGGCSPRLRVVTSGPAGEVAEMLPADEPLDSGLGTPSTWPCSTGTTVAIPTSTWSHVHCTPAQGRRRPLGRPRDAASPPAVEVPPFDHVQLLDLLAGLEGTQRATATVEVRSGDGVRRGRPAPRRWTGPRGSRRCGWRRDAFPWSEVSTDGPLCCPRIAIHCSRGATGGTWRGPPLPGVEPRRPRLDGTGARRRPHHRCGRVERPRVGRGRAGGGGLEPPTRDLGGFTLARRAPAARSDTSSPSPGAARLGLRWAPGDRRAQLRRPPLGAVLPRSTASPSRCGVVRRAVCGGRGLRGHVSRRGHLACPRRPRVSRRLWPAAMGVWWQRTGVRRVLERRRGPLECRRGV